MILRDRVHLIMRQQVGQDGHGPIFEDVDHGLIPANVQAIAGQQNLADANISVITRYRITLAPRIEIPHNVGNDLRIGWQDFGDPQYPSTYMSPEGGVERHMLGRRLHHYELIVKAIA